MMNLKNVRRGRIQEYANEFNADYIEGHNPWKVKTDIALPCATQNELSLTDAKDLLNNGCICIAEGANMPTEPDAVTLFIEKGVLFGPGKAANAGGVSVSGLEMTQNSMRLNWSRQEVDDKLRSIMRSIHEQCINYGSEGDKVNYEEGEGRKGPAAVNVTLA